jgi:hypothetical protein
MLGASGRWGIGSTLLLLGAPLGCATTPEAPPRQLLRLHPLVLVTLPHDAERGAATWIDAHLPAALGRLAIHGLALHHTTEVRLFTTRTAFARATGKHQPWLRAWTTWSLVQLLSPAWWSDSGEAAQLERLTHEFSHAALFQGLGSERDVRRIRPPLWFIEGTASVVAGQLSRRMPLPLVVERAGDANPLLADKRLLAEDHHVVYGAAHHALAWLAAEHGPEVIGRLTEAARVDGRRGAVNRVVERELGHTPVSLWGALKRSLVGA